MGKTVRKVWNIVSSVIVALAVLLAVALVGVVAFTAKKRTID